MVLMGLHDEERRARQWVETKLDFDRDGNYNTFEVRVPLHSLRKPIQALCIQTDNYSSARGATLGTLSHECAYIS